MQLASLESSLLALALFASLAMLIGAIYFVGVPVSRRWLRRALVAERVVHLFWGKESPLSAPMLSLGGGARSLVFAAREQVISMDELDTFAKAVEQAATSASWAWPRVAVRLLERRRDTRLLARAQTARESLLAELLVKQKAATFTALVGAGLSTPELKTSLASVNTPEELDAFRRHVEGLRANKTDGYGKTPLASERSTHA